jgi:hypothetical protein
VLHSADAAFEAHDTQPGPSRPADSRRAAACLARKPWWYITGVDLLLGEVGTVFLGGLACPYNRRNASRE